MNSPIMTRSDLIDRLAYLHPKLQSKDAEMVVRVILDAMADTLARGDRVEIRGFGAFSTKQRDARVGRNPRTGVHVPVEEKLVPVFRAGKEMRERINRSRQQV